MRTQLFSLGIACLAFCASTFGLDKKPASEKPQFSMTNAFGQGDKKVPMGFEPNMGQFEDESGNAIPDFYYRFMAKDAHIYISNKGISYLFFKSAGEHKPHKQGEAEHDSVLYNRVDVDLVGANIAKENVVEEEALDFFSNYYYPNAKTIGVKQYQKLTIRDIYPGIDWVWHLSEKNGGQIKYDFIVHPNADPSQIKMLYKWADISIENGNAVTIKTPLREVKEGEAISYVNSQEITTSYEVKDNVVSYQIGNYDHSQTLTIDPPLNLIWGTYFGGTAWEKNTDVSNYIDANGNVFVVGNTFSSSNMPLQNPGGGAYYQGTYGGGAGIQGHGGDICIFKFTNLGALVWCTYYGGSNHDNGASITCDPSNNVYVTGCSLSTNFPLQNLGGAYNQATMQGGANTNGEGGDAVVMKFTNNGNLLWATYYGGSQSEGGRGIVTDAAGNVFMVGWTESTNFPLNNPGGGAYYQATNGGGRDAFVVKFNTAGAQVWSTYYGGNGNDIAHYICRDMTTGMMFVGESASTAGFPLQNPGAGAYFQNTNGGASDAFIAKINLAGALNWSTFFGGAGADVARGVDVSAAGAVYACGQTASTNFPTLNPGSGAYYQAANAGSTDGFFVRFTNPGVLVWSTYYGGSAQDDACAVITDPCGHIYSTGNTFSTDLPLQDPGNGAFFISSLLAMDDVWYASFTPLNGMLWSTYCGTTGFDEKGTSLKVDANGHLFIVGYWCFYSTSNAYLPVTGAYNKSNTGADDFFIAKFDIASCSVAPFNFYLCHGTSTVISMPNLFNLTNPSYSIQPGAIVQSSPNFTVSPTANTTYTLYITGLNSNNVTVTYSTIANGTVYPAPVAVPNLLNSTCTSTNNFVNIAVSFQPSGSPNYTTTWSPFPANFSTINSATASGLVPGPNSATITSQHGCTTVANFSVGAIQQPAAFIVINPSNDYTITCINPNVLLTTSVTNGVPLTFVWAPCSPTVGGPSYNFTTQCVGTVIGTSSTGCNVGQTYTVYQNFMSPTVAITPSVMNITCNTAAGTFTGTSDLHPNVTTNWYQVIGTNTIYVGTPQGTINIFQPGQPGVYWFESIYNITGCRSTKSVQVTASVGVPQFTVTSSTNFTIGCSTKSITNLQVTYVLTSPVQNVNVTYAFMQPPVTSTPAASAFQGNPNLNNLTVPGTYVIYVRDETNSCISSQSISIIQNTIAPNIDFIQPLSLLTCRDPSMVLTGISSNTNTNITWTVPAIPSNSVNPTPNATVNINPGITGSANFITVIGTWTVGAVDNNNLCVNRKTVQILQDIRIPSFSISALTNSNITCVNPDVVIVPITSTMVSQQLVPTFMWYSPVGGIQPGSQFNTTAPGSHTAISTSAVNGCTYAATYIVGSDLAPPPLSASDFTVDCATNPMVTIFPTITGTTTGFTYSWYVPPGAITSNLTSYSLTTNKSGDYHVVVTNTINGCKSEVGVAVFDGSIHAAFTPVPDMGFAPLAVTFNNNSTTSTGASSIISTWGYGNGAVTPTVYNNVPTSATYTAAGTYSVILRVRKGNCIDTAMRIIIVEIPSKLEIPNVFTPNNDGSNDIFRLRASNLKEINITIYDRWGTVVYDLVTETGNFAWDGKNLQGKNCAAGVYFYVLKAKGKDAKEFEHKGNVSLFR